MELLKMSGMGLAVEYKTQILSIDWRFNRK